MNGVLLFVFTVKICRKNHTAIVSCAVVICKISLVLVLFFYSFFSLLFITSLLAWLDWPLIDILFTKHKSTKIVGSSEWRRERVGKKGKSVLDANLCHCSMRWMGFFFAMFFPSFISLSRTNWRSLYRSLKFAIPAAVQQRNLLQLLPPTLSFNIFFLI